MSSGQQAAEATGERGQEPGQYDAFITAALLLLGDGMAAEELSERLQPLVGGDAKAALTKLQHMVQLGLSRPARREGGELAFEPTRLGRAYTDAILNGQAKVMEELEALDTMRNELLAAIAHEFRTPLTAVRTAVSLLLDPALPHGSPQERRLLQAIGQSSEIMQRLVTDFLDLARFRAGTIRLEMRRFDARRLAKEAVGAMAALFESRNQKVVLPAQKDRLWVHGDHKRLLHALINLLSNAHKFAPEGSTIYVTTERQNGDMLWTVTDTGPGISEETRGMLFERFFSMSRPDSEASQGTGLGLPLVMATARAHGGTVDVASAPGQGSSFTLRIAANGSREEVEL